MSSDNEHLLPLNDAVVFECLWLEVWRDCRAQPNRRRGRGQASVDVFGTDADRCVSRQAKKVGVVP